MKGAIDHHSWLVGFARAACGLGCNPFGAPRGLRKVALIAASAASGEYRASIPAHMAWVGSRA